MAARRAVVVVLAALLLVITGGCSTTTAPPHTQAVVFDGQSLNLLPKPPNNYPSILMERRPSLKWANVAVNAFGWALLAPTEAQRLYPSASLADETVLVMLGGEADLVAGDSGKRVYDREVAYAKGARSAGFDKVILCTIPGAFIFEDDPEAETARLTHNKIAKRDPDSAFDAVVDLDTPPLTWRRGSPYYSKDEVHPSAKGAMEIADRVDVALTNVLSGT